MRYYRLEIEGCGIFCKTNQHGEEELDVLTYELADRHTPTKYDIDAKENNAKHYFTEDFYRENRHLIKRIKKASDKVILKVIDDNDVEKVYVQDYAQICAILKK